jgi:hypothetical protein
MVTQEYNIERNLGYFTLDDATNNESTKRCIATKLGDHDIKFDPVKRRLRCLSHIVNLVVKVFLWGDDPETFEHEVNSICNRGDEEAELDLWRKRGPLGKFHNIIVWIGQSLQRQDKLEERVKQLHPETTATALAHGIETRWRGDHNELVSALQHRKALEEVLSTAIQ